MGRFINADAYVSTGQGLRGYNMFAYCNNNPVNFYDPTGEITIATLILIGSIIAAVAAAGYTAYVEYEAGCSTEQIIGDSLCAGMSTFMLVYSLGMTAYQWYQYYCYLQGITPVTQIGGQSSIITQSQAYAGSTNVKTPVIGKMSDLNNTKLGPNEFKVADLLPDMGSPQANWKQNSSVLRSYMDGRPIKDVSPYPMNNAGFLGAERNLLSNHGYVYHDGYWIKP